LCGNGNSLKHAFQVVGDLVISNPKDAKSLALHPGIASGVSSSIDVRGAVDLDNQPCGRTEKVGNVGADRNLSAKLESVQLLGAKPVPQPLLCPGAVQPHGSGEAKQPLPLLDPSPGPLPQGEGESFSLPPPCIPETVPEGQFQMCEFEGSR